jgi:glycosyltransferase involved in cell wall biosynthesis
MPARNARAFLPRAVASLARQTFRDFEIVAVDDGSTDDTGPWLERAAAREPRLRVLRTPSIGLPAALNWGLAHARAPIVARMDADDLSHSRRFEIQLGHLRRHREVSVIGSRARLFPEGAFGVGMRRWIEWHNDLLTHRTMAREVLIDSPLLHGTAMIRREWLDRMGGWTAEPWAEDLDLWIRMLESGAHFAKRPEVLYAWRQHANNATRRDPRYARERFLQLKIDALARRLLEPDRPATVLGVGTSLARWHEALARRFPSTRCIEARDPTSGLLSRLQPPLVLVLVAYQRRDLWRQALVNIGYIETDQFVFVA